MRLAGAIRRMLNRKLSMAWERWQFWYAELMEQKRRLRRAMARHPLHPLHTHTPLASLACTSTPVAV